jgi:hypothetical protein
MVALIDHQPSLDRAYTTFDETRVLIEHEATDPGVGQQRLDPRQADDIVGAQQLLHSQPALLANTARP